MKQIIQYQKTGEISVEDLPDIKLSNGGILVQNYYSLISAGTERTSVKTAQASLLGKAKSRPDLVKQVIENLKREGILATYSKVMNRLDNYKELGYSSAGIVIESNVEEFRPGDRVACAGSAYHSELIFIPKNLAVKVPNEVELDQAAFTTLGAIALQGVRQANVKLGENVAVIGLGLIGLITIQLLKANGCRVIGLDISDRNFKLAEKLGCDSTFIFNNNSLSVVESFTNGYGTDAVLITASTKSNEPLEYAIQYARKKSRIVFVGVAGMNIPRSGFYEKELEITISCSYGPGRYDYDYEQNGNDYPIGYVRWTEKRNMEAVIQLLQQKKLDFSKLITHKIPVDDAIRAYDLITNKTNEPYLGVLIEYSKEIKSSFIRSKSLNIKQAQKNNTIKIGFIGAGNFAQSYLLPNLKKNTELVSVCTTKPINAKSVAQKFDFNYATTDPNEIINDININTVFIATRHDSHAKYVIASLKASKNVYVEKPLAITAEELEGIKEAYSKSGKYLFVGFNRRFSKPVIDIQKFFETRSEPMFMNYRVNAGYIPKEHWVQDIDQGGRIIGEGCHFINTMQFLTNSKIKRVFAASIRTNNLKMIEQDTVNITIEFADGSIGNLQYLANGDSSVPKEYLEVFSGGKTAIMNNFKSVEFYENGNVRKQKYNGGKGHKEEIEYFVSVLKDGVKPNLSFESIYETTLVTFKILNSLKLRTAIDL